MGSGRRRKGRGASAPAVELGSIEGRPTRGCCLGRSAELRSPSSFGFRHNALTLGGEDTHKERPERASCITPVHPIVNDDSHTRVKWEEILDGLGTRFVTTSRYRGEKRKECQPDRLRTRFPRSFDQTY